jgi:hypothetical protein
MEACTTPPQPFLDDVVTEGLATMERARIITYWHGSAE